MSVADTIGVAAMAGILARLAGGETPSVAELAAELGLARSTGFDIVRRLKAAGLVERNGEGALRSGPSAAALAFAAFGLAPLRGPGEALVAWLRDQANACVSLEAGGTVLVAFDAGWRRAGVALEANLDGAVVDAGGVERARLRLAWRPDAGRAERVEIGGFFERTRQSLEYYLRGEHEK